MPWKVQRDEQVCSVAKPWALKNADTDELVACHATEDDAERQRRALEANVNEERSAKIAALLDAGLPEFRAMPFIDFEAQDDGWGFRGLAAAYGQEADLGEFTEEFARGAFRRPLASGENTRLIHDHSPPHVPVLATLRAKTMRIKDDVKGLDVSASIAKHYLGEAVRELIKRGDIKGMSPGMIVGRGNSELQMRSTKPHRIIRSLKHLPELSLTPDPAYAGTTAEIRSLWAFQMAESLGGPQQVLMGAYPQLESRATPQPVDTSEESAVPQACETCGADPCGCTPAEQDPAAEPVEERDSGVSEVDAELAARRRRLKLMGLSLPKDDKAWLAADKPAEPEQRTVVRDLDEVLRYPAATWSTEERELVLERRKQVQAERFAIVSEAERVGRNLSKEEAERYAALDDEFQRLGE